eukprot:TRINITY_DN11956_c0_g1_i2.p1 TRINITY_DN11956_c0_g1~~TRINITY_DN11956_c0_g1_i2.p1  ORF type:complete len:139 (-),score=11.78 TRINITY_DN11956_c0_g1_i2:538-954(-)
MVSLVPMVIAAVGMVSCISALQLPPQAAGLQCLPYHGTVCSGVVDYEYLPTPGQTAEEQDRSISDSLSKFEGKIYECRIAAKRYFCASAFSKCRQMKLPAGGDPYQQPAQLTGILCSPECRGRANLPDTSVQKCMQAV